MTWVINGRCDNPDCETGSNGTICQVEVPKDELPEGWWQITSPHGAISIFCSNDCAYGWLGETHHAKLAVTA